MLGADAAGDEKCRHRHDVALATKMLGGGPDALSRR
jgi:hypothetical protein